MIKISVYKDGREFLFSFESPVVPPDGEMLWLDDGNTFYTVTSAIYKVDTARKRLVVDLCVK